MYRLDVGRVIVPPASAYVFGVLTVGDNIGIIGDRFRFSRS